MKKITSEEIKKFVSKPLFDKKVVMNKNTSWPKISIVTPSYNQAEFLERTILSVLNQNYPNLEYIIIDGGSTDGSVEIIKKYEQYLTCWVSERDNGQADAINIGFERATGEIIAWQNSDDIYLPDAFTQIANVFLKKPEIDLVFGNIYFLDTEDIIIRDLRFVSFAYMSLIYEGTVLANQAAFWRKDLLYQSGLLNTKFKFSIDYDLWIRMGKVARFSFLRRYIGCFRFHKTSKSGTIPETGCNEHLKILNREGINANSLSYKIWETASIMRRLMFYLAQGDIDYLMRGIYLRFIKVLKRSGERLNKDKRT